MSTSTGPSYYSDEEILKRLYAFLAERPLGRDAESEVRTLFGELASRIHDDPERWGLSSIPASFRDDAARDALVDLLAATDTVKGQRFVSDWFAATVEDRFRQMWSAQERAAMLKNHNGPDSGSRAPLDIDAAFDAPEGPWQRFEREFPRDASALKLRYQQGHTPDELEVMLDAPSASAVKTRLGRARSRFRMFVEQAGYDRREVSAILERFDEGADA